MSKEQDPPQWHVPAAITDPVAREAIQLLINFIDGYACVWASSREQGETCRQYRSRLQGVPCPGCDQCEARDFLYRLDQTNPNPRP